MRRLLLAAALTATTAGWGPCDGIGGASDDIADAVEAADESGRPFRLAEVTDFEWDRFYAIQGYFSQENVDKRLGFHWGDASNSDFARSDGGMLLVFVHDREVVEAFDQDTGHGDFSCLAWRGLSPAQAVLRVERHVEGKNLFRLVRAPGRQPRSCAF
jgi:hypothetical protein